MSLQLQAWVEKTVHGVETHWLSGKEKVPAATVSKVGYSDSILEHEKTPHNWFPWKNVQL